MPLQSLNLDEEENLPKGKEEKKIESTVLKVFNEKKTGRGISRLRIVKWGKWAPTLEKREFWFDEKVDPPVEKTGKAKGFKLEDVDLIIANIDEIKTLLKP
ncbi:MAG: hypothetical protein EHJ94_08550 [Deltaproteobacteria bacterium]|nr:MAG: hypothetical protein EHJ94_08550 [Deltaproteobacteria bacterium]